MAIPRQLRQGDVLLTPIEIEEKKFDKTKATKVEPEAGLTILAKGEATGHHHSILAQNADILQIPEIGPVLQVRKNSSLRHQEHDFIEIFGGESFEISIQREYDPLGTRVVKD